MPLTKVTKSLITSVDVSQINTTASDAGKVLTSNGSTLSWTVSSLLGTRASSLSAKGYTTFENGLIIQWGVTNTTVNTFAIPFSNSLFVVILDPAGLNVGGGGAAAADYWSISTQNLSGFTAKAVSNTNWVAIGY